TRDLHPRPLPPRPTPLRPLRTRPARRTRPLGRPRRAARDDGGRSLRLLARPGPGAAPARDALPGGVVHRRGGSCRGAAVADRGPRAASEPRADDASGDTPTGAWILIDGTWPVQDPAEAVIPEGHTRGRGYLAGLRQAA